MEVIPPKRLKQIVPILPRPQVRRSEIPLEISGTTKPYRKLADYFGTLWRQSFNTAILKRYERDDPQGFTEHLNKEDAENYSGHIALAALTGRGHLRLQIDNQEHSLLLRAGTVVHLDPALPHVVSPPDTQEPRYLLFLGKQRHP